MEYQFESVYPAIRIVVSVLTIAFAVALLALIVIIADQFQRLKICFAALTHPLCFDDEYAGASSKPILILPRSIPVKGM